MPTPPTTSGPPLVTSVVLNWRKPDMTATCVEHLLESDYPRHEVVIVDNGSADGSAEALRRRFPQLTVLASNENLGFSRGCNLGVRHALSRGSNYVALVNNDLRLEPQSVRHAIEALEDDATLGAVTGKVYSAEPRVIWQAGGHVSHWRVMGVARGLKEVDQGQYDRAEPTRWASGAMSTFRASALQEIGLLPEEYFFGQEEWDFSTNLIRRGHHIGYVPQYVGHHANGSSYTSHPALNSYGAVRNRHLYAEKYLGSLAYRAWRLAFWAHLHFVIRSKLRIRGTHRDAHVHVRAMHLGWSRHRAAAPVTLGELQDVSQQLGIPSGWDSPERPGERAREDHGDRP